MLERSLDESLEQLGRIFSPGPFLDRRLGRALAFQALYEMDMGHHPPGQVLDRLAESFQEASSGPYPPEVLKDAAAYAHELVRGVLANRAAIDALIQQRAPLERSRRAQAASGPRLSPRHPWDPTNQAVVPHPSARRRTRRAPRMATNHPATSPGEEKGA
jgi:hypothetical protein